jgi:hypothetical protein
MKKIKNLVLYDEDIDIIVFFKNKKINFQRIVKMLLRNYINEKEKNGI